MAEDTIGFRLVRAGTTTVPGNGTEQSPIIPGPADASEVWTLMARTPLPGAGQHISIGAKDGTAVFAAYFYDAGTDDWFINFENNTGDPITISWMVVAARLPT